MGTASPPPAAVVAGEPALAAGATVASRTPAFLLAHGLPDSRRHRAGRPDRGDRDRAGRHPGELGAWHDRLAARAVRNGGAERDPSLLAADGRLDRRGGKNREG